MSKHKCGKLHVLALSLASGTVFALGALSLAWSASLSGWGLDMVASMGSVCKGFTPSFIGGIVGALWGFVDGFISGAILAMLYNRFSSIECGSDCSIGKHCR